MKFRQLIYSSILWRGVYFLSVFILNIFVARYFEASVSGALYYISNYFTLLLFTGSFCLETGMTYYGARGEIPRNNLAWFSIVWSLLIVILLYIFLPHMPGIGQDYFSDNMVVLYGIFYCFGILLTTYFAALFYKEGKYLLPNSILSAGNFLLLLFAFICIVFKKSEWIQQYFFTAYFLLFCLQGIAVALAYMISYKLIFHFNLPSRNALQLLFKFSLVAFASNLVFYFLYRIDYWFIQHWCTICLPGDLGNYIQVSKLAQLFLVLPTILSTVLFPSAAGGDRNVARINLLTLSRLLFAFNISMLLLLGLAGKWLFPFVFGNSFNNMYLPYLLLIPGILSLSMASLLSAYNAGKKNLWVNVYATLLALILMVTGDYFLIPIWGISGAAFVSSLVYTFYFLFLLIFFFREYKVSMKAYFIPTINDLKKIAALKISR